MTNTNIAVLGHRCVCMLCVYNVAIVGFDIQICSVFTLTQIQYLPIEMPPASLPVRALSSDLRTFAPSASPRPKQVSLAPMPAQPASPSLHLGCPPALQILHPLHISTSLPAPPYRSLQGVIFSAHARRRKDVSLDCDAKRVLMVPGMLFMDRVWPTYEQICDCQEGLGAAMQPVNIRQDCAILNFGCSTW